MTPYSVSLPKAAVVDGLFSVTGVVCNHQVAELVRELRQELDALLGDKIEAPELDLVTCPRGSRIIDTIITLISTQ